MNIHRRSTIGLRTSRPTTKRIRPEATGPSIVVPSFGRSWSGKGDNPRATNLTVRKHFLESRTFLASGTVHAPERRHCLETLSGITKLRSARREAQEGQRLVVEVSLTNLRWRMADGGWRMADVLRRSFPDRQLLKDHADPCTGSPADLACPAHAADQEFKARGNPGGVDHLQTSPVPGEVADRTIQNGRLLVKDDFPRFQGPQTRILSMLVHPPAPEASRSPPILRANGY